MKRSQIHLTAAFICDLPVTPERSPSPSISCAHRDAEALELAQISTTGGAWNRRCNHQGLTNQYDGAAGSAQLHFKVSFPDKNKSCSIDKSVCGLESCRYNGNILRLRSHISCSPILFLFPTCLSVQASKWCALLHHAYHKQLLKLMKRPFSPPVTRKQSISLGCPWAETDVEPNGRQELLSKCT